MRDGGKARGRNTWSRVVSNGKKGARGEERERGEGEREREERGRGRETGVGESGRAKHPQHLVDF